MSRLTRPVLSHSNGFNHLARMLHAIAARSALVLLVLAFGSFGPSEPVCAQTTPDEPSAAPESRSIGGCEEALSRAQHSYEAGAFREVISTFESCSPNDMNNDDAWRAYRLTAIAYLLLNQTDSADMAISSMLRLNPMYKSAPERDPYEFIKALEPYTYYSRFAVGAFVQFYKPTVGVLQANSVTQTFASASDYTTPSKTNFGGEFAFQVYPNVSLATDVVLLYEDLSRDTHPVPGVSTLYAENISSLALPVFGRLKLFDWKVQPFVEAGGFGQWLTSVVAKITVTQLGTATAAGGGSTLLPDGNTSDRRKTFNYGWVVGAGALYPLSSTSDLVLRARYWNGLVDLTRPSARYTSSLFLPGYFEDDDIALRGFEFSLGVNLLFGFREHKS